MEGLSDEQIGKVHQFQEISGKEDFRECRDLLEQYDWDLTRVVNHTVLSPGDEEDSLLEEGWNSSSVYNDTPEPLMSYNVMPHEVRSRNIYGSHIPAMDLSPFDQRELTVPSHEEQISWAHWIFSIVFLPFQIIKDILLPFYRLLLLPTNPAVDTETFLSDFASMHESCSLRPAFMEGSYGQALQEARHQLKFFVIYLRRGERNPESPANIFEKDVLCSQEFLSLLSEKQCLIWGADVAQKEGHRVMKLIRPTVLPFLGVMLLRDSRMTLVFRSNGCVGLSTLISRMKRAFDDTEISLVSARLDRDSLQENQLLRQEQDWAYEESLRLDREKELKREEEKKNAELMDLRTKEKLENLEKLKQERISCKQKWISRIPLEPSSDHPDAICMVIKFPDGTRLRRRFLKTDSLELLFNFIFCSEGAPDVFQVVRNFPRRPLDCVPLSAVHLMRSSTDGESDESRCVEPRTFQEEGIDRDEILFVQDNET